MQGAMVRADGGRINRLQAALHSCHRVLALHSGIPRRKICFEAWDPSSQSSPLTMLLLTSAGSSDWRKMVETPQ